MSWSYIGLLAGAVNEAMVRIPFFNQEGAAPWVTSQGRVTLFVLAWGDDGR